MKLSLLLVIVNVWLVSATGFTQTRLSLNLKDVTLKQVFSEIENRTSFSFLYKANDINPDQKVDIVASNTSIEEILNHLFADKEVQYKILDNSLIVLLPAAKVQQVRINGKVTDSNTGDPLIGVSIIVDGTSLGTVSDMDGNFSLELPDPNATLVFSYVGYISRKVSAAGQTTLNVKLDPDVAKLDEVVVVGYGVQKKKLVTGATVQVKNEDLVRNHTVRVESALQGITPGMTIVKQSGQPGSDYNISIRGLSSPNGNGPLVLVDGVPSTLNTLNPSDIETIDVLKDAASAAIYGSRAASGVILITTKKGRSGEPQVTYDFYGGFSNPTRKVPMLNAKEYAIIMNEAAINSNSQPFFSQNYINSLGKGTDWQQEAYNKNAPMQSHYLGVSGGNDRSTYSLSLSYNLEEGIFDYDKKSRYERIGFRVNSEHKIKKFLTMGENFTYTHRASRGLGVTTYINSFMRDLLQANPIMPPYDTASYDGFARSRFNQDQINPLASMHYNYNEKRKYDDLVGDVYAEIEFFKGFRYRTDFGGTLSFTNNSNATDTFTLTPSTYVSVPTYRQDMSRNFGYNFDNVLSYERNFGKHNILLMAGTNAQDNWLFNVNGRVDGYLTNAAPVLSNVGTIDTTIVKGDFGKGDSRFSYFGRLSYNYNEKYLATVTFRRDGSSRFGKNHRYGNFPSVSAGWVITQEDFMAPTNRWLDFFKLRASWGLNGKEPAFQYVYLATVGNDNRYYSFGSKQVGISPTIIANPDLKWESSEQIDVGFDSRFLRNFSLTVDWYRKTSKDWIMQTTVPGTSGIAGISNDNPFINGGNVINSGIEFELGYIKSFGDFSLDVRANLAYNKNKVTQVPGGFINGNTNVLYNGSPTIYRVAENYPIGYFWGYKTAGIFQTQEQVNNYKGSNGKPLQPGALPGDVIFQNLNGDSVIDDNDKTMIGDPNPNYVYGFNISLAYKGFDFSMNLQGQLGNQIVQAYRGEERYYNNYTTNMLDRWTGPGTSNRIPRITLSDEANQNWRRFNDLYVQDADYLRIKSVNLGYDFKKTLLRNIGVQQFRIYFSATNLLTFTKYKGLDPEVGYGSYFDSAGRLQDAYASGIDLGFYPTPRTYMVGVNVKF